MSGGGEAPLPAWRVEEHASLPSTQQALKARLAAGEDVDGLVIRALEQPAGVGRRGKAWSGAPGGSYQSAALADRTGALRQPWVTLAIGVGIAEQLQAAGAQARVKWPNDLYLTGAKLAGVLCEHVHGHLVVGVGVNVANTVPDGAAALRGWRLQVVNELILDGVRAGLSELVLGAPREAGESASPGLPERFAAHDFLAGRWVELLTPAGEVAGTERGVDASGALLVETDGGVARVVDGSVIRWGPASGSGGG